LSNGRVTKNERREQAREKARQMREEQKKRDRRNKLLVQGGIIVGSLGIIALITVLIINAVRPAGPGPLNMLSDGLRVGQGFVATTTPALEPGEDPVPNEPDEGDVIDIQMYVDFLCPYCGAFEATNGEYIRGLLENGGATVEIHPIAILDRVSNGTKYSTRAANAFACMANFSPNQAYEFHTLLFENQPQENTAGLSDDELVALAEQAGAENLSNVEQCIRDQTFKAWVADARERALNNPIPNTDGATVTGTPTVIVNGQKYPGAVDDPAQFAAFVVQVAGDAFNESNTATPTPTPSPTPTP
jgi:protein-disulfide isomerase